MRALVHLVYGEKVPDCTKCRGEERLRAQFGCDGPATSECYCRGRGCADCGGAGRLPLIVVEVSCQFCDGEGWAAPDVACTHCTRGNFPLYRCPKKLLEAHPSGVSIARAFTYAQHYESNGVLPAAGGMGDQTPGFLELLGIYNAERSAIARRNSPEAKKERQEAAKRKRDAKIAAVGVQSWPGVAS